MKMFSIVVTKSFLIEIEAESEKKAKLYSEFFTSDITDLSEEKDRKEHAFKIDSIKCVSNESININSVSIDSN